MLCRAISLHRHPAGNDLGRMEESITHGNNLKSTECGFQGYSNGGRVFSQRGFEMRRGNAEPVTMSQDHFKSRAANFTSQTEYAGGQALPPPPLPSLLIQRVSIFKICLKCPIK